MAVDHLEMFRWLYHIAHTLHEQQGDTQAILQASLFICRDAVQAESGCIVLLADDGSIKDARLTETQRHGAEEILWQWLAGRVAHHRKLIYFPDIGAGIPLPQLAADGTSLAGGAVVAVPLLYGEQLYGALMLMHSHVDYFESYAIDWLEHAAGTIAAALQTAERMERSVQAEAHHRHVFEDSLVPIIVTDMRGRILQASAKAASLFGYARHALVGMPLTSIYEVQRDTLATIMQADNGCETTFVTTGQTAQKERFSLRVTARRSQTNLLTCILWVLNPESAGSDRNAERDLLAMTYHDMRGLLQNLEAAVSRLSRLTQGEQHPAYAQLMEIATRSAQQLTRMTSTLLDVERLEAGYVALDRRPTLLTTLVEHAAELLYVQIQEAEQELRLDLDTDLPLVWTDSDMMLRVLTNLIENAVKHTPEGGMITLSAKLDGDAIKVCVRDTGPGIPPEVREHIFDKYVRLNHRTASGVGLGLAFCRMAVEAHGGKIWVENGTERGAAFCFSLPVELQPESLAPLG